MQLPKQWRGNQVICFLLQHNSSCHQTREEECDLHSLVSDLIHRSLTQAGWLSRKKNARLLHHCEA
jgi:hypothetical protein